MPRNATDVSKRAFVALATPSKSALWLRLLASVLYFTTDALERLKYFGGPVLLTLMAGWVTGRAEGETFAAAAVPPDSSAVAGAAVPSSAGGPHAAAGSGDRMDQAGLRLVAEED